MRKAYLTLAAVALVLLSRLHCRPAHDRLAEFVYRGRLVPYDYLQRFAHGSHHCYYSRHYYCRLHHQISRLVTKMLLVRQMGQMGQMAVMGREKDHSVSDRSIQIYRASAMSLCLLSFGVDGE